MFSGVVKMFSVPVMRKLFLPCSYVALHNISKRSWDIITRTYINIVVHSKCVKCQFGANYAFNLCRTAAYWMNSLSSLSYYWLITGLDYSATHTRSSSLWQTPPPEYGWKEAAPYISPLFFGFFAPSVSFLCGSVRRRLTYFNWTPASSFFLITKNV